MSMKMRAAASLLLALLAAQVHAGTDGAMPLFFEQQLEVGYRAGDAPSVQNGLARLRIPPLPVS